MKAKKSYGQHFLKEEPIAQRIAQSLQLLDTYSDILEVGPGMGMLTKYLLQIPDKQLSVVEADPDMVTYLQTHYPQLSPRIWAEDFLQTDLTTHYAGQFGLIGNFPYNISTQIVFKMLEHKTQIPEMVGMFQREVAERLAATPNGKEYGILSVLAQAYYVPKILFYVKPGSFNPPPNVQSAVIRLERRPILDLGCDEAKFKEIVKTTFGQRRKMLRNTMNFFLPKDVVMDNSLFDFEKRPENLSVSDFVQLTNLVGAHQT